MLYGFLEASAAVLAACLPTLRPLTKRIPLAQVLGAVHSRFSLRSFRKSHGSSNPYTEMEILAPVQVLNLEEIPRKEYHRTYPHNAIVVKTEIVSGNEPKHLFEANRKPGTI